MTLIPECGHPDGHAWVTGKPVFPNEEVERIPENVEYVTRQCRRCGYHDDTPPEDQ